MIKDFISAMKKLTLSKKKKMLAGNQLYVKEKQTLLLASFLLLLPLFIGAVTYIIYLVEM